MDRAQTIAAHPDFPWLDLNDPEGVEDFLRQRDWLDAGESLTACENAGEGNMNLTLRVHTPRRTMILKQARPWVEKYDHIAAPWDRMQFEQRFYERVQSIHEAADMMPRLLGADAEAATLLLEDLSGAEELANLYRGGSLTSDELAHLAGYLAALHQATLGQPELRFENREMRSLNHQHIYQIPLDRQNGLDLEAFEPGLEAAARALQDDATYCDQVEETGRRYLAEGRCLLHGDFFPGSWLRTDKGLKVIDPEFCYYGDPEFDLGCAIGHFALADQRPTTAYTLLDHYRRRSDHVALDQAWIARYAAIEVMRRVIGVAQLPLVQRAGFRADLLRRSRETLGHESLEWLWN
jgi:5-methylthioribose kinase